MGNTGGMSEPSVVLPFTPGADSVDLKHLRAFVAVADDLNFGRAAERLYVSAPALSRQVRSLERVVGCQLFRRSTHRVELTLAGEALLDCARNVLGDLDRGILATRAIGGELHARMFNLLDPITEAGQRAGNLTAVRAANERLHAQFPIDTDVEILPVTAGGVPALQLNPAQQTSSKVLFFLHGGGFVMGSAFGYRAFAATLASQARTAALIPDFRLAPEHPFPAAVDDATTAYQWLIDNGTPARDIVIAAESAGCCLALQMLLRLKEQKIAQPAAAVLLCPWLDLSTPGDDDFEQGPIPMRELVRGYINSYLAGAPIDDPRISPLHADLTGLPRMLVQAASGDAMLKDARRLVDRATELGVDARLDLYPVPTHTFHTFWSFLPEAATAMRAAGEYVQSVRVPT